MDFQSLKQRIIKSRVSVWLATIAILLSFTAGVYAGGQADVFGSTGGQEVIKGADPSVASSSSSVIKQDGKVPDYLVKDANFDLFWQVWKLVQDKYYDKNVPDTQLFYGAVSGIVASLNDPYSVFMTPTDSAQFQEDLKGNFEGIGAEISSKAGVLVIVSPLPDTPAIKAGLKPKDIIVKINGTSTEGMSTDAAVKLIRGQKGTKVILSIFRDGFTQPKDFEIVRDAINVKSVSWEFKGDVAIVKVRQFNDDTYPLVDQAINEMRSRGVKKLVFDLRNNPGGYLESAIDISGEWVVGQPVVKERLRDGSETAHAPTTATRLNDYQTIVLINGGSASASEIVAGALQDYGLAKIVGEKSFGKGSVQELESLPDGSSLKLTIAKWFTPKGRSIDEQGISPDLEVKLTEEDFNKDRDPQMDKALELLR